MQPEPVESVCQQIHSKQYNEYILCTMTHNLGGVSHKKWAQIIRDIFPYKPFVHINTALIDENEACSDDDQSNVESEDDAEIKCKVLEDGNRHLSLLKWTEIELKRHDEALKGWARWEVDYGAKVVRSTKCQGTTVDLGWICSECMVVLKDESFPVEVRKV